MERHPASEWESLSVSGNHVRFIYFQLSPFSLVLDLEKRPPSVPLVLCVCLPPGWRHLWAIQSGASASWVRLWLTARSSSVSCRASRSLRVVRSSSCRMLVHNSAAWGRWMRLAHPCSDLSWINSSIFLYYSKLPDPIYKRLLLILVPGILCFSLQINNENRFFLFNDFHLLVFFFFPADLNKI